MRIEKGDKSLRRVMIVLNEDHYKTFKILCVKEDKSVSAQFEVMFFEYLNNHYSPSDLTVR